MTGASRVGSDDTSVRALHVDGDSDALDAVAAYVKRECRDVTVTSTDEGNRATELRSNGEFDCLVVGREVPGVSLSAFVAEVDRPVVLYTDAPGGVGEAVLEHVDTLVEKGNGDRSRHLLVEKLRATVRDGGRSAADRPTLRDRTSDRASYFLVYADGSVVWSSDPFEEVFPVSTVEGTVPDTASLDERLTAMLASDPDAIRAIRGGGDGTACFSIPTTRGPVHYRYARHSLPDSIGPLDLVAVEDVTDAVDRTGRLETLEPLVERARDGLYLLDETGTIEFCNDSFAAMLGYEPADLIGEHATETLQEGELERGQAVVDRLLTDPDADGTEIDMTFVDADGEPFEVSIHFTVLTDEAGGYEGLVGVARDVTEHRERERTLEQYRAVVESAGDPMYALDTEHRLVLVNDAMAALLDAPRSDLVGTPLADLFPATTVDRICETVETVRGEDRRRDTCEIRLTDADGRERLFEATVGVLRSNGSLEGSVGTLHDVTGRERRESDLDLLKQILSRVLRHDVRSGLTVVRGQAEVLAERTSGDRRRMAEKIIERSEDLADTVEKVRTIGDVLESDTGRVTLDLRTAVDRGIEAVDAAHPDAEYRVEGSGRTLVTAHPTLPYAVENLIENAVVHNEGDAPRVTVTIEERGDRVLLRVTDDGPGISRTEIDVLERREETPLKHGTGAGLWLVSWVVERSGGEIDFETDEDGTTVTLTLERTDGDGDR